MPRYIAFLRGLNVGGHTVKMDALRKHFEDLGLRSVSTFIASGNVIFESDETASAALERRIEAALKAALGYEVATFLRTDAELAAIASYTPFPDAEARASDTRYVLFLQNEPDAETRRRVLAFSNDQDLLHLHQRELYWLRRGGLLDTAIDQNAFAKAFGKAPTTSRNVNTVRRLAAKYPPSR